MLNNNKKSCRKKSKIFEFSKKIVIAMVLLIFATAIFSAVIIWRDKYGLEGLQEYVLGLGAAAIIGYFAKVFVENPIKLKKKIEQESEEKNGTKGN
ncbi:MAG: hypothetical protein RR540_07770 [Oscillospiraceae bacterium]